MPCYFVYNGANKTCGISGISIPMMMYNCSKYWFYLRDRIARIHSNNDVIDTVSQRIAVVSIMFMMVVLDGMVVQY